MGHLPPPRQGPRARDPPHQPGPPNPRGGYLRVQGAVRRETNRGGAAPAELQVLRADGQLGPRKLQQAPLALGRRAHGHPRLDHHPHRVRQGPVHPPQAGRRAQVPEVPHLVPHLAFTSFSTTLWNSDRIFARTFKYIVGRITKSR